MADLHGSRRWLMRSVFIILALVVIYVRLMPIDNPAGAWGAPDLLLAMTFAWVLRRPDYAPVPAVAAVWLMADLMLLRPPGLMTALVLAGVLVVRQRQREIGSMPFTAEWLTVSLAFLVILLTERAVLAVLLIPMPPAGQGVIQMIVTALAYPPMVLVVQVLFGVRRISPGELGAARVRL